GQLSGGVGTRDAVGTRLRGVLRVLRSRLGEAEGSEGLVVSHVNEESSGLKRPERRYATSIRMSRLGNDPFCGADSPFAQGFPSLMMHLTTKSVADAVPRRSRVDGASHAAGARNSRHPGCARSTPRTSHAVPCGARGAKRSVHPISRGVRSPLMLLQRRQHATRFSQLSAPPRERGITWSIVDACTPQ